MIDIFREAILPRFIFIIIMRDDQILFRVETYENIINELLFEKNSFHVCFVFTFCALFRLKGYGS